MRVTRFEHGKVEVVRLQDEPGGARTYFIGTWIDGTFPGERKFKELARIYGPSRKRNATRLARAWNEMIERENA